MNRIFTAKFWIELIVVGLLMVLFGYISGYLVGLVNDVNMTGCDFNRNYVMEQTLFLTGALFYFVLEMGNVNQWFCMSNKMCSK
jgi:hypothetical protein